MKIETKFDIDEEVYLINDEIFMYEKIVAFHITNDIENFSIDYEIENFPDILFNEKSLFKTTKDLYKHVEKEIKKLLKDKE